MVWAIGALIWFGVVLALSFYYLKQEGDKSYDVSVATQGASQANAKCDSIQNSIGEMEDKIDSISRGLQGLHDFEIEQRTSTQATLKSILDDMEKIKSRQISIENKMLVHEKTLTLKIFDPIPIEVKHPTPVPPPAPKKRSEKR